MLLKLSLFLTGAAGVLGDAGVRGRNLDGHLPGSSDYTDDYPNAGSTFLAADGMCQNYCDTYFSACATQNDFYDASDPRGGGRRLMAGSNVPEIERHGATTEIAEARGHCFSACMQYPRPMNPALYDEPEALGSNTIGDTLWCRMTHLALAQSSGVYDEAAAFCLAAGPQGGGICTEALVDGATPHEHYREGETTRRHLGYCDLLGDDTIADCTKASITDTTLPVALSLLPDSVEQIYLNGNLGITELGSGIFDNLSCPKCIKVLFAEECRIATISHQAFEPLTNLESLYLSVNMLMELPSGVFDGNEELKDLSLLGNYISMLPADLFSTNHHLERLVMWGNSRLTSIPGGIFSGLGELNTINLANCGITNVGLRGGVFDGLHSLSYVFLFQNSLDRVDSDWFADSWANNIAHVSLASNNINYIDSESFRYMDSLEFAFLHHNDGLTQIPNNLFSANRNLISYTIGRNTQEEEACDISGTWHYDVSCFISQEGADALGIPVLPGNEGVLGPLPVAGQYNVYERDDGNYNMWGTYAPGTQFNITLSQKFGNAHEYFGAQTWSYEYPGTEYATFPPPQLPPIGQVSVHVADDCSSFRVKTIQMQAIYSRICYGDAMRSTPPPVSPMEDPITDVVGEYDAHVTCRFGDNVAANINNDTSTNPNLFEWTETHHIIDNDQGPYGVYPMLRVRSDNWQSLAHLMVDELDPHKMEGLTKNITNWNMESTDVAYYDFTLAPLQSVDLWFDEDYHGYDAVLVGSRPGMGATYTNHVCRINATRSGRRRMTKSKERRRLDGHEGGSCNLVGFTGGWYSSDVSCSRYEDTQEYGQDQRVIDLDGGFFKVTSSMYQSGVDDNILRQEMVVVEDPGTPGRYLGGVYARNDYQYKTWSIGDVGYPLHMMVTLQAEGEDGETCTGFSSIIRSFLGPTLSPRPDDVVQVCNVDATFKNMVAVINEDACSGPDFTDCNGVCYEAPLEYAEPCVAGLGVFGAPSFPRNALLPRPIVVGRTCASMGFNVQQLFESCPDPFYDRANAVCVLTAGDYNIFDNFDAIQAGSPFLQIGIWPEWQDWGYMWMADNPQCDYHPPGEPDYATNCNIVAGRYSCTTASCFSGNVEVLSGTPGATAVDDNDLFVPPVPPEITSASPGVFTLPLYIFDNGPRDFSLNYYDMTILDHPNDTWLWNATVYQLTTDENKMLGNVYWNNITGTGHVEEDIEVTFRPTEGCSFEMVWQGTSGAPETWPNNVHNCNWMCQRIRN